MPMVNLLLALILAPLVPGIINRTKAKFAGRQGKPLFQAYFDLAKLLRKGAVYSRTTTWVFRAGPVVGLSAILTALCLIPLGGTAGLLPFTGDLLVVLYLLAMVRLFTVLAALDTGSAFEGMGASREVTYSALAEPAFCLGLLALARLTGDLSLSEIFSALATLPEGGGTVIALVATTLMLVALTENSRIPVDDPNTHLELTMIHEVMILDHSGVDLAFIQYGAALKLWLFGALVVGMLLPQSAWQGVDSLLHLGGIALFAVVIGVVESGMARLRLVRIPQFLAAAGALSIMALLFAAR